MIKCNVSNVAIEITETETLTAGRVGLECQFTFSSEWDGLAITAYFLGSTTKAVVVNGNTVTVPAESMAEPGYKLYVGVVGKNAQGNIVIPTLWASAGKIKRSPGEEEEATPSPDVVAQIQLMAMEALEKATYAKGVIDDNLEAITEAGETQTEAVNTEGSTQVLAIQTESSTQQAAIAAAAAAARDSIPEDYTALSGDVDDLKSKIDNFEIPEVTVDGYNLIKIAEHGVGAYYASGNTLTFKASYTDYHYAIMPVERNSRYYVSTNPRWWVLTDDNNNVLSSGAGFNPYTKKYIDTGNATKFYYTIDNGSWNSEITYGRQFALIVAKSNNGSGSLDNVSKPEWLSGISQRMCDSKYAFAFSRIKALFTVNTIKTYYFKNLLALDSNCTYIATDASLIHEITKDYIALKSTSAGEKGIWAYVYDSNLSLVEQQSKISAVVKSDNLSNCSALVIGDSTVAQNTMTQKMLDAFTAKGKTLTLLGTQGTAPNLHEGRSGWRAKQYCTQSANNPFYNNGFDFSHYMTEHGYSAVDFVVLQIGINDLYNINFNEADDKIAETIGYVCNMIDSILAWNSSQKIIINLLTPINPNYNTHFAYFKRNIFVRYNAKMILELTKYAYANVRPSDTFAILDPESDISDNVHPTAVGYEKMALEVVNQINCWQNGV